MLLPPNPLAAAAALHGGMPAASVGVTAPGPAAGMPPAAVVDAMLKLAAIYRHEETNPKDLLAMERVSTLLQQILSDRAQSAGRPLLGGLG